MKILEKIKQLMNTKNHKHEIIFMDGLGWRCKYCGKTKLDCRKENKK